jgi:hypothetical protein
MCPAVARPDADCSSDPLNPEGRPSKQGDRPHPLAVASGIEVKVLRRHCLLCYYSVMDKNLGVLLDNLIYVNSYSLDTTLKELEPDPDQRTLPLSEDDFFKHLYEERQADDLIKKKIRSRDQNLLCLVGPKGSGKTTLGRKVIRDLRESGTFVIYIDIRLLRSDRTVAERSDDATVLLFRHLRNSYFDALFPSPSRGEKSVDLLWQFLLDPSQLSQKPREIFVQLQDLEAEAYSLYEGWKLAKEERKSMKLAQWIKETQFREPTTRDLLRRLRYEVAFPQLLHAARHVYGLTRHLIWVDNIDGLPDVEQSAIVHSLADLNRLISDYASSVIALRESNVFREGDLEDGAPPLSTRILLEAPRTVGGHVVYPSVDVPVISAVRLRAIVEKRIVFANADTSTKQRLVTEKMMGELLALSNRLSSIFERDRAIYLANNSIRDLLRIHRDCLAFILRSPSEDSWPPAAQRYDDWYLATLFFLWVSCTQRQYNFSTYDIISLKEQWKSAGSEQPGCFLPHVLMTCIWNFSIERTDRGYKNALPTVREVVDRVSLLGFGAETIREEIVLLHRDRFGQRFNFVEVRTPRVIGTSSDLMDEERLYLTYRAKTILAFSSSSFGYFYGCARRLKETDDELIIAHPIIHMENFFKEVGYKHLRDLAEMHVSALINLSNKKALGEKSSLHKYRQWFGVPLKGPYTRKSSASASRNALSLELLFSSLVSHCRQRMDITELKNIETGFNQSIQTLTSAEEGDA